MRKDIALPAAKPIIPIRSPNYHLPRATKLIILILISFSSSPQQPSPPAAPDYVMNQIGPNNQPRCGAVSCGDNDDYDLIMFIHVDFSDNLVVNLERKV